jgi:hypothetical protein
MPAPTTAPEPSSEGVRTAPPPSLVGSRCPVCQEKVLQGRQTVCSGRCRANRSRDSRIGRGRPGTRWRRACLVAPGLRVVPRSAALCNVPNVNIPLLLHLYLIVHIPSRRDSIETGKRANPSLKVRTSVKPPISKVKPDSPYMQEHAHPIQNDFTAKHASPY